MHELILAVLFWTVLWPFFVLALFTSPLTSPLIHLVINRKLRRDPTYPLYLQYKAQLEEQRRRQTAFWLGLNGWQFEHELAALFEALGYKAEVTRGSGDRGVDIWLTRDSTRTIVQCKRHSKPAGPALVRELIGTLALERADAAILACTGGFTVGARRAANGQAVTLLDLKGILRLKEQTLQ